MAMGIGLQPLSQALGRSRLDGRRDIHLRHKVSIDGSTRWRGQDPIVHTPGRSSDDLTRNISQCTATAMERSCAIAVTVLA